MFFDVNFSVMSFWRSITKERIEERYSPLGQCQYWRIVDCLTYRITGHFN